MVRKAFTITGLVQGVFFRKFLSEKAVSLGLTGFVRNQPDGSVYAEVQGTEDKVDQLFDWCQNGSPASRVEMVVATSIDIREEESFTIQRSVS